MLRITVVINCENAAFNENGEHEVSRILREAAKKIDLCGLAHGGFPLRDVNGNTVGEVKAEMDAE